jgi:hypothetical protein
MYSFVVDVLINIDKYFGFGTVVVGIQLFVAAIGFIMFLFLLTKLELFKLDKLLDEH